jgi:hypothetical protein
VEFKSRQAVANALWLRSFYAAVPYRSTANCPDKIEAGGIVSSASCLDAIVDGVLCRVLPFFERSRLLEDVLQPYPVVE